MKDLTPKPVMIVPATVLLMAFTLSGLATDRQTVSLRGSVKFEGTSKPPDPKRLDIVVWDLAQEEAFRPIAALRAPNTFPHGPAADDGTFSIDGLVPGTTYAIDVWRSGPGWWLQSITIAKKNVVDAPFLADAALPSSPVSITYSDRPTTVSGTVANIPAPGAVMVVIFPADSSWRNSPWNRTKTYRIGADRAFKIGPSLPPGEYMIATTPASDFPPKGSWVAALFQPLVANAIKFTLVTGDAKRFDLTYAGR